LPVEEGTDLKDYSSTMTPDGTLVFTPKQIDPTKPLKDQVLVYGAEGQFAKSTTDEKPLTQVISGKLYTSSDNGKTWSLSIDAGTEGTTEEKAFYDDISKQQNQLATGKVTWGQAFNVLKAKYGAPDDVIDMLLNKEKWAVPGAYEATKKKETIEDISWATAQ
ncbi:MAG: hypothetical protein WC477_07445, partial [Patescibacteria group bacterium]